jgi:MFS-type transporter involved in bile tolerance (Atg22 family)
MRPQRLGVHIAMLLIFAAIGLTQFTENVRTVQILGLFACGMVVGVSFSGIVNALKERKKAA